MMTECSVVSDNPLVGHNFAIGKCSQYILKFEKLVLGQRGIFNSLDEEDAVDTQKYYKQQSLGRGIIAVILPWLINLIYIFRSGASKELTPFFTTPEQLLKIMKTSVYSGPLPIF